LIARRRFEGDWPGLCFGRAEALPDIVRGRGRGATAYAVYRVSEPRRNLETLGCYWPPSTPP
jgi:hypothetical protein